MREYLLAFYNGMLCGLGNPEPLRQQQRRLRLVALRRRRAIRPKPSPFGTVSAWESAGGILKRAIAEVSACEK